MKDRKFWVLGILSILVIVLLPMAGQGWTEDCPYSKEGGAPDLYQGPGDPDGDGDADDLSVYATQLPPRIEVRPHNGEGFDPKAPTGGLKLKRKGDWEDLRYTLRFILVQTLSRLWIR